MKLDKYFVLNYLFQLINYGKNIKTMLKQYYILWFYKLPKIVSKHENEINGDLYLKLKKQYVINVLPQFSVTCNAKFTVAQKCIFLCP